MPTTITMPQLGETVTEGTVAQWLKKPGDSVEKYEAFVEVSTDKVNAEVPAPVAGTIRELIVSEGQTVPTGAPIAIIDEVGASAAAVMDSAPPADANAVPASGVAANESARRQPSAPSTENGIPQAPTQLHVEPSSYGATGGLVRSAGDAGRIAESVRQGSDEPVPGHNVAVGTNGASRAGASANTAEVLRGVSPAVRRLAREHDIDITSVRGTGHNGRVTAEDILAAAKSGPSAGVAAQLSADNAEYVASDGRGAVATPSAPAAVPSAPSAPATSPSPVRPGSAGAAMPGRKIALTQARRIIAQRMVESKRTAPHAWTMVEVDVTNLWRWRAREKDTFEQEYGVKLTLLPFFMRAVVEALAAFPLMNASFAEDGIDVHRDVHLGIAIAVDSNLVVPVVRHADTLSIKGLALAAGAIIEKARRGKLGADDLAGGTFTVNNTGANGSVLSAPILVPGQAGIVTMEAVVKRPVVRDDDSIAVRSMMNVCLSLDHRVVDGAVASGFLVDLCRRLEAMGPSGSL